MSTEIEVRIICPICMDGRPAPIYAPTYSFEEFNLHLETEHDFEVTYEEENPSWDEEEDLPE